MSVVQIILFKEAGKLHHNGVVTSIAANQLVVTSEQATAVGGYKKLNMFCYPGEIHEVYYEVMDLLTEDPNNTPFFMASSKSLPVFGDLINVIEQLHDVSRKLLIKFIFTYCLGLDNSYFSKLLNHYSTHNDSLLNYIEENYTQPWSVAQFADDLGIEVRKLNLLFYKNYGISAKKWLLERRLVYARQQLVSTKKKVADIAYEAGFSSHSHFSGSFKKRFQCSPTQLNADIT
ncbi:AraC family transcriptional regulator [uncultured Shewanella sp.]|uniref:helix-turn-helix domain-containing protein n=1 Tax=uncultured Shewanella sp. TaxID=173975 RepID=UPI0026134B48|nr:AraC family transcriptional regulator [uncultured Shewanella sp.]